MKRCVEGCRLATNQFNEECLRGRSDPPLVHKAGAAVREAEVPALVDHGAVIIVFVAERPDALIESIRASEISAIYCDRQLTSIFWRFVDHRIHRIGI